MAEVTGGGLTADQVNAMIQAAMAGGGITAAVAQSMIDAAVANRPTTTAMNGAISSATSGVVKSVNANNPDGSGNVAITIPTTSSIASQITTATSGLATQSALSTVQASVPAPASSAPPSVADNSALGTQTSIYALANHTHASKVRKIRAQSAADGTITWTFNPPFTTGVTPIVLAVAEVTTGVTDVVNVQVIDTPTATSCKLLVNRTNRSTVALLGLTILSLPSSPGATWVHAVALEP